MIPMYHCQIKLIPPANNTHSDYLSLIVFMRRVKTFWLLSETTGQISSSALSGKVLFWVFLAHHN